MTKALRLLLYARELLLMVIFIPAAKLYKVFSPEFRDLWLVGERGNDARDNGYCFYCYIKKNHPEINARYVITETGADTHKIKELGGAVNYRSFRHYLAYYSAKYLIGTHIQPCSPDLMVYYHLAGKGIKAPGKQIFLQHGISYNDMTWLSGRYLYIDLFVCGAQPEYDYIKTLGHDKNVVKYLGFSRFDNLVHAKEAEKMILVMPTWRGAHYPAGDKFADTEFCKSYCSLLKNQEIIKMLDEHDYKLIFYPHVEMQKYMHYFKEACASDRIIAADKSTHDVQALLMSCAMLITDYSSVFFDVAYMGKPVLYYQFDEEEFNSRHYKKAYFDYRGDAFGPVCDNEAELAAQIGKCFETGMKQTKEYRERAEKFFRLHDDKNSERIFNAIAEL